MSSKHKTTMKTSQKQKLNRRVPEADLTRSEQEILDRWPAPGVLMMRDKPKELVNQTYLIYVILHTTLESPPRVVIRKAYESQKQALDAFKREYTLWITGSIKRGLYQRRHTDQQLTNSYLLNVMEMNKKKDAALIGNTSGAKYQGRGRVEYALVHRDDVELEDNDHRKRKCVVICQESTIEHR